jgi:hypothetical protein
MVELFKILVSALASAAVVAGVLYAIVSLLSRPKKPAQAVKM